MKSSFQFLQQTQNQKVSTRSDTKTLPIRHSKDDKVTSHRTFYITRKSTKLWPGKKAIVEGNEEASSTEHCPAKKDFVQENQDDTSWLQACLLATNG